MHLANNNRRHQLLSALWFRISKPILIHCGVYSCSTCILTDFALSIQCNRGRSLDAFFDDVVLQPDSVKIGLIGCGCSVATEPVAEISHKWNISQVPFIVTNLVAVIFLSILFKFWVWIKPMLYSYMFLHRSPLPRQFQLSVTEHDSGTISGPTQTLRTMCQHFSQCWTTTGGDELYFSPRMKTSSPRFSAMCMLWKKTTNKWKNKQTNEKTNKKTKHTNSKVIYCYCIPPNNLDQTELLFVFCWGL